MDLLSKKFKGQKVEAGLKEYYTIDSSACKPTITIYKKSKQNL
jgi:hypothetical protein